MAVAAVRAAAPRPLEPAQALALILGAVRPLASERVALAPDLAGRVLARELRSPLDLPPFAVSAMDGYALRAADLARGPLPIAFRIAAGDAPAPLPPGHAAAIATGAPVPPGADAVVPVELADERDGTLAAPAPSAGANVRLPGGDARRGQRVAAAGTVLAPAHLAAIAAVGIAELELARRPSVAVLATGDELVAPGGTLAPGQIYESNGVAMAALALRAGALVHGRRRVADDRAATRAALEEALAADVVISSGGVSVGPHDHVKPALAELGVRELLWRVALKPGKPLWAGVAPSGALVFGLPGNPVSSLVCFELFVRPALRALMGASPEPRRRGVLAATVERLEDRVHAVRVLLREGERGPELEPLSGQESHQIVHAAGADALALIDRGEGRVEAGAAVDFVLI